MGSLWWMQPGWRQTRCHCGTKIWPEGDPDWGECLSCFSARVEAEQQPYPVPICDICEKHDACAGVGNYGVCSQGCAEEAERRIKELRTAHAAEADAGEGDR